MRRALQLSPRDPFLGLWRFYLSDAELGLGHLDAAIDECHNAIDAGFRLYPIYRNMAAIYALQGKMDDAKSALAEARRINPKLAVKLVMSVGMNIPALFEGLRKAGLPEE